MTNAWVVVDQAEIVAGSTLGRAGTGTRVVFEVRGEELVEDMLKEHNQIYGGLDAVAVTAYSAPAKSIVENRWRYGTTTDLGLELWFGPQERLIKRVIDSIYAANSAVWVLTDDCAEPGLAKALEDKAQWGFDMQIVVGPNFGRTESEVSLDVEAALRDVPLRQVTDVEYVPTVVLVDYPADGEGFRPYTMAMVLTHDLWPAGRLFQRPSQDPNAPVEGRITDQFVDGAMWVLTDTSEPSGQLLELEELFRAHFDRSVEL
jgi:hypothetical protein